MRIKLFTILFLVLLTFSCMTVRETKGLIEVHSASSIDEAEQEAAKICGYNKTPELTYSDMGNFPGPSPGYASFRCTDKQALKPDIGQSGSVSELSRPPSY